ncbi:hypothetical protein HHA03_17730 [Halolactibacillus halophilus]|uniref:Secreted protein n=1 Tax=Halolactibacillus halophilus TaxID=306540 RepID=A0ABQ0VM92_9BACI|nr:hypothetical protein HHA03_17730 [Halolactibacillus halophilus]
MAYNFTFFPSVFLTFSSPKSTCICCPMGESSSALYEREDMTFGITYNSRNSFTYVLTVISPTSLN